MGFYEQCSDAGLFFSGADSAPEVLYALPPAEQGTVMKVAAKNSAKTTAESMNGKAAHSSSSRPARSAPMTHEELLRDMAAYRKKVTATKASALTFLKRIGAPV
ncbi:MAG: hypothetical protein LBQ20_12615 [Rhodanobacter sp.]|nr:hypothetical protein [Rhodanobacter sp.]